MSKDVSSKLAAELADDEEEKREKVVVIDDDQTVLTALNLVLRGRYEVICHTDPVAGVTAASMPGVAAVVVDVKMPGKDGFWVFQQIRQRRPQVPIIFNSAYQDFKVPDEIKAFFRPYAYLTKTGNLRDFLTTLEAAVTGVPPT